MNSISIECHMYRYIPLWYDMDVEMSLLNVNKIPDDQVLHMPLNPILGTRMSFGCLHTPLQLKINQNKKPQWYLAYTISTEYQMTETEIPQMALNTNTPNAIRSEGWQNE